MPVFAEIIGWEFLLVIGLVALLFGSSQIPKFARSIGEASRELKKGMAEGAADDGAGTASGAAPAAAPESPESTGDTADRK